MRGLIVSSHQKTCTMITLYKEVFSAILKFGAQILPYMKSYICQKVPILKDMGLSYSLGLVKCFNEDKTLKNHIKVEDYLYINKEVEC